MSKQIKLEQRLIFSNPYQGINVSKLSLLNIRSIQHSSDQQRNANVEILCRPISPFTVKGNGKIPKETDTLFIEHNTGMDTERIATLKSLPHLDRLAFVFGSLSANEMSCLKDLRGLKQLLFKRIVFDRAMLQALSEVTTLELLEFHDVFYTDDVREEDFDCLRNLSNMKHILLSNHHEESEPDFMDCFNRIFPGRVNWEIRKGYSYSGFAWHYKYDNYSTKVKGSCPLNANGIKVEEKSVNAIIANNLLEKAKILSTQSKKENGLQTPSDYLLTTAKSFDLMLKIYLKLNRLTEAEELFEDRTETHIKEFLIIRALIDIGKKEEAQKRFLGMHFETEEERLNFGQDCRVLEERSDAVGDVVVSDELSDILNDDLEELQRLQEHYNDKTDADILIRLLFSTFIIDISPNITNIGQARELLKTLYQRNKVDVDNFCSKLLNQMQNGINNGKLNRFIETLDILNRRPKAINYLRTIKDDKLSDTDRLLIVSMLARKNELDLALEYVELFNEKSYKATALLYVADKYADLS